ncbi:MAG: PD-(D/E)XK nuclease family protein [Saprospiraceae bacterium]|nr:PD-(D/E)XK nuclease family protein [Saprospiraceae bacterium]
MIVQFGLALDDLSFPLPAASTGGYASLGPKNLLYTLESHFGFAGHANDNDYLRIEQYRQALLQYLQEDQETFYLSSFAADQFATAAELLSRRDELLLAGWDFNRSGTLPARLYTLASVEALFKEQEGEIPALPLAAGYADRWITIIETLGQRAQPIQELRLTEPLELLPYYLQRFFAALQQAGVKLQLPRKDQAEGDTDLAVLQRRLAAASKQKVSLKGDGSLLILRGKRETDLAVHMAKLFHKNEPWRPLCLIPDKSRVLDDALIQEGVPCLGILSASLARPTLQVLKLVTVFLWEPIDPYKILEFVSLSLKPLHHDLAGAIASSMAQYPGLDSDGWKTMINRFFDQLEFKAQFDLQLKPLAIREEFEFWFGRKRYNVQDVVPVGDVISIFERLHKWAYNTFEEGGNENSSLVVLGEQANRIVDLLNALPETHLNYLELERIVKTIYEPAPVEFRATECGSLPYIHHPAALTAEADQLLWWNFTQHEPDHFFSRWYNDERAYLADKEVKLVGPKEENAVMLWQRKNPILKTKKQLVLVIPEWVEGSVAHAHPLYGDLAATFEDLSPITWNIDEEESSAFWEKFLLPPKWVTVELRNLGQPAPFINISQAHPLATREIESLTSLEDLFYYPYQWVFKHAIKLRKSTILSVVKENTLMGNLAHRFFEQLFDQDIGKWDKSQVEYWIDQEAPELLKKEGAIFLLYGREPEKVAFIKKVKYAAWNLVHLIQQNGWEVEATELRMKGEFQQIEVRGRADLVLRRGAEKAILDLKWRGASRRERMIKNEEDLQLVLYSRLVDDPKSWAHTAYYVMDRARLIARNTSAFQEINPVAPGSDHTAVNQQIFDKMGLTYSWRLQQLQAGQIEVRCERTYGDLEDHYGAALLPLLEMKDKDAPFDDYRTLINLIE